MLMIAVCHSFIGAAGKNLPMEKVKKFETEIAGRKLIVESGLLANQANASVTVRYGDTVVLATAVMSPEAREGMNYFPLMVDYEEKFYASGKIKGSRFIKREGRPTDEAVLNGRLIDRTLRPLFNQQNAKRSAGDCHGSFDRPGE